MSRVQNGPNRHTVLLGTYTHVVRARCRKVNIHKAQDGPIIGVSPWYTCEPGQGGRRGQRGANGGATCVELLYSYTL